jgi:hypothetical protein
LLLAALVYSLARSLPWFLGLSGSVAQARQTRRGDLARGPKPTFRVLGGVGVRISGDAKISEGLTGFSGLP